MKKISFEETKKIELDILKNVAEFCEEHNLRYFLAYGTLIGAVRHHGFIPWDDDIDIQMPRADYEKFVALFNEQRTVPYYKAISPWDKAARHTFVKVIDTRTVKMEEGVYYKNENDYLGIDIDIFPLDGQPEDEDEFLKYYERKRQLYIKYSHIILHAEARTPLRNIAKCCRRCFLSIIPGKRAMLKEAEKINAPYTYEESKFVGSTDSLYNLKKDRMRKEYYRDTVMLTFEDEAFCAPIEYDAVLRQIYGDYMQLPPEEKRITHHENKVYWKEEV